MDKVNFEITDVESFLKFPHIEPIVIITSISEDGTIDAAVKTWFALINLKPCMVTCSGNIQHQTAKNI
jgi:flavin reductase (DIM6/NTAB) family NADH-FMN oxidoreductase RutF